MSEHALRLVRLGIDTHQEPVVYMRADCHVCRSEGFSAQSRVRLSTERGSLLATLNVVHGHLLAHQYEGLIKKAKLRGATSRGNPGGR